MLTASSETVGSEIAGKDSFKFHGFQVSRFQNLETLFPGKLEFRSRLLADAEFGNNGFVTLGIVFLEVVEQATALADQHEKSAA